MHKDEPLESNEIEEEEETLDVLANASQEDMSMDPIEPTTVKDVQEAINTSHPFGLKIWKPALYKKHRSVNKTATESLRATPGSIPAKSLLPGNVGWLLLFGWWIALEYATLSIFLLGPFYLVGRIAKYGIGSMSHDTRLKRIIHALVNDLLKAGEYCKIMLEMSFYILWPFGKYITRQQVHPSADRARDPSELDGLLSHQEPAVTPESFLLGEDVPTQPSLPRGRSTRLRSHTPRHRSNGYRRATSQHSKNIFIRWLKRTFGNGFMAAFFYCLYFILIAPIHIIVSILCSLLVVPIPMAKLNYLLMKHLLRHPLELACHRSLSVKPSDGACHVSGSANAETSSPNVRPTSIPSWRQSSFIPGIAFIPAGSPLLSTLEAGDMTHDNQTVVLCLYQAMGLNYYKYTIDGINILVINLFSLVLFTILDFYYIAPRQGNTGIAAHGVMFTSALVSTIPLAYCIGMAVSSITAQTGSIALGSVINATFGSIIEIILYCLAIMDGKERMVEGAIIGSILCGLLALPGVSMFSGGLKRKEQTFNAKAAGVSTTMLVMAVIGVFSPTIFQMIYGSVEMDCKPCVGSKDPTCQRCHITQPHPTRDPVYLQRTRPFMYVCAVALLLTYAIGLWFTLRTHTKKIYAPHKKNKKKGKRPIRLNPLLDDDPEARAGSSTEPERPRSLPTFSSLKQRRQPLNQDPMESSRSSQSPLSSSASLPSHHDGILGILGQNLTSTMHQITSEIRSKIEDMDASGTDSDSEEEEQVGHDHPNWSSTKSAFILLGCTILYSLIAEVLIGSVDGFISSVPVDEKVLGLTLFAIAPTVTEFYNAISFAMSGNIALSLEIGSAYVIQVTLLQIPVLVAFSALYLSPAPQLHEWIPSRWIAKTAHQLSLGSFPLSQPQHNHHPKTLQGFTLIFPHWDLCVILFSVFILSYTYIEGKSNYFKGAMLLLAYGVLISGFLF